MDAFVTSTADVRSPRILYGTAWKKDDTESLVRPGLQIQMKMAEATAAPEES